MRTCVGDCALCLRYDIACKFMDGLQANIEMTTCPKNTNWLPYVKEESPVKQIVDIKVPVPEEVLLSLRVDNDEFAAQMKKLTALKLYENRKLSIGQSAAFAGMNETDFIKFLGQNKISIFGSASDIAEDFSNA